MTGVAERSRTRRIWSPVGAPRVTGLRRRRPRDLAAVVRLLRLVHYEAQYPETWPDAPRAWLADTDVLDAWVIERHDEILGHVAVSEVGRDTVTAYRWREMTGRDPSELLAVTRLFVRARARRQGLGVALLDEAVADIRRRDRVPVLQVCAPREAAVRMLESRGWRLLSMDSWGDRRERRRVHCYAAPREPVHSS